MSNSGLGVDDLVVIGRLLEENTISTALDLSVNRIAGEEGAVCTLCCVFLCTLAMCSRNP